MMNIISKGLNQRAISAIRNGSETRLQNQLKKLFLIQTKNICHKDDLDPDQVALRLPPFPYKKKRINWFHHYGKLEGFHPTFGKFTENTKMLSIEGNIGAGKEEIGKKLAEDMGMLFVPDVTPEMDYKYDEDDWDFRDLNKYLHEDVKFPDFKSVLETRNPYQAGYWEIALMRLRTYNYLQALTHLLNTGDGIIFERSVWSGTAFARTANDFNMVGQDYLTHYWEIRSRVLTTLYRPHVVIYIDVPIDKCLENARKKNSHGAGELLDEDYLESVEHNLKKHFLPIIEEHAEVFTYKLNEPVTEATAPELSELIVDDLSRSNMDEYFMRITSDDQKFDDWCMLDSDERYNNLRVELTRDKSDYLEPFDFFPYYVDELWPAHSLLFARNHVCERELTKRHRKLMAQKSFWRKLMGDKKTYDDVDTFEWFLKTGFFPDHVYQAFPFE